MLSIIGFILTQRKKKGQAYTLKFIDEKSELSKEKIRFEISYYLWSLDIWKVLKQVQVSISKKD